MPEMTTRKMLKRPKQNTKNTKHNSQEPQSEDSDDQSDQSGESDLDSRSDESDGEEEQSSGESDDDDDQSSEESDSEEDDQLSEESDEDQSSEGSEDDEEEDQSSEGSDFEEDDQSNDESEDQSSEGSDSDEDEQTTDEEESDPNREQDSESEDEDGDGESSEESSSELEQQSRKGHQPQRKSGQRSRQNLKESRRKKGLDNQTQQHNRSPSKHQKSKGKTPSPAKPAKKLGRKHDIPKQKRTPSPAKPAKKLDTRRDPRTSSSEDSDYDDEDDDADRIPHKSDNSKAARGHGDRGTDSYSRRRSHENRRNKPDPPRGARRENKTKDIWLNSAGQVCRDRHTARTFHPEGQSKHAHKKRYSDKCSAYDLVEILAREEDLDSSILQVLRERNAKYEDVQTVLSKYTNIFHTKSDRFCLKPRLELCTEHSSSKGCENMTDCIGLHICQNFLKGICKYKVCDLGHNLATGHNKKVLGNFSLDRLGDDTLLRVLSKSLPITSNSQNGSADQRTRHSSLSQEFLETSESDAYSLSEDDESNANHLHGGSKRKKPSLNKKKRQIQTVWSTDSNGDVEIPEICYNSVEGSCPRQDEGCEKLHSLQHFYWQISKDNSKWFNLLPKLVLCLEKSYCNVSEDGVTLPRLKGVDLQAVHIDAVKILSRDEWTSDFQSMTLVNSIHKVQLHLRRLCTEKTDSASVKANTFCWYFRDDNQWLSYDNSEEQGLSNIATSKDIEKHYLAKPSTPFNVTKQRFSYVLDFQKMCQVNVITTKRREIRRRPLNHLQNTPDRSSLPEDSPCPWGTGQGAASKTGPAGWEAMQPKERMRLVDLDPNSDEYKKVITLLKDDTHKAKVHKIQRNQNPYLWKTFQLRKEEMINQYGDEASVNMTDLFHGTNPDIVSNICKENFDFRLHGKSTGHIWGKGSYFGNDITYCYRYCRPDPSGLRYLFVAKVLVGTMTVGAKELQRPPLNPATGDLFDTTVDNVTQPNIFVKYDKQEYYPHYVVIMT